MNDNERQETRGEVDRTGWPAGPWDGEPDRVEWRARGLACLMVRGDLGQWCGYVGLPPGHPWRALDQASIDAAADAHGGITYGPEACAGRICHVPRPGEVDDVRWIGFDCAHCFDAVPGLMRWRHGHRALLPGEAYRDVAFVVAEVERLAGQAEEEARGAGGAER